MTYDRGNWCRPRNRGTFAIMKRSFLLVVLALTAIAIACDDGDESISGPPGQVGVEELSFGEVRERALAALWRPGQVYHGTHTTERTGPTWRSEFVSEVWLDLESDLARVKEDEHLRIFHEGKIAELGPRGRFQDAAAWDAPGLDKTSALSLDHIVTLFAKDIESTRLSAAEVEGGPAILVEAVRPYRGDYTGTRFIQVYLDDAFLPLRLETRTEISEIGETEESSTRFDNEFVEWESLPEDFFSPEAVRALEVTPADDIARAAEAGLVPYWLGQRFEEMVLEDAMETEFDGGRALHVTYGGGGSGPEDPPFTVAIWQCTADDWERWRAASPQVPWWERRAAIRTPVIVLGVEATLYELPKAVPPVPNGGPEGGESSWLVLVRLEDTVLRIEPSGGPPGSNPYKDAEALVRLANSIRPFERPLE